VAETARAYAGGGAAAMSVLCAQRDFGGSLDDLTAARRVVDLPAIAKDFTVFPEQVAAQRLAGADAILVILAMVSDDEARRLLQAAELLGMDALVETHSAEEVERALGLEAGVIGVNARDLDTLAVDRERQLELVAGLPDSVVRVAESGVSSRADVEAARDAGADAVLVGTALMRTPGLLAELVGVAR
jgi:indole-3-glycerol phosphate synthase